MEKKAMSASQISTISATQVSSSWSIYSIRARKRKRACDIVLPIKMDIADVHEIFRQLRFARYGQGPFSKFENWKDEHLWESLLQVIIERRSFHIHLKTVIFVILEYAKKYAKDTSVGWINDDALKSDVISVFKSEPLVDQKGCLSVEQLEVIIRNMNNTGLLADDEQVDESINSGGRNSGGRNTVKRFRGSGSTSSGLILLWIFPGERRLKCSEKFEAVLGMELGNIPKQLNHLYNTGQLSARQVNDAINQFCPETDQRCIMKAQMWLEMSEANKVNYIKDFSPSTDTI